MQQSDHSCSNRNRHATITTVMPRTPHPCRIHDNDAATYTPQSQQMCSIQQCRNCATALQHSCTHPPCDAACNHQPCNSQPMPCNACIGFRTRCIASFLQTLIARDCPRIKHRSTICQSYTHHLSNSHRNELSLVC